MTFKPYPQQSAIMDHFADPNSGSLIVEACAGAGKSTTVLEAVLASSDATTLICAFNTRIKDDMEAKFSTRGRCTRSG
jgi:16S rRNA C967 or C1407 C5-methylase (RsmB/RsmF family)